MIHVTVHFALGMAVGMVLSAPRLARAWRGGCPVARHAARMLAWAYGIGLFAVVPNVLLNLGLPPAVCSGWWMNLFMLHPLIDQLGHGAAVTGQAACGLLFAAQYALLVLAVHRAAPRPRP